MTRTEMLKALSINGEVNEADFNDTLNGYFGWDVCFENDAAILTVRFEDYETDLSNERKWILIPVGVRGELRV